MLSTLVSCKKCGERLPGKSANGNAGKIPYYEHGWLTKRGSHIKGLDHTCWPYRVLSRDIENAVWKEIVKVLDSEEVVKNLLHEAQLAQRLNPGSREIERARQTVFSVDEKLETLSERLASLPSTISPTPIYNQMQKFENLKNDGLEKIRELEASGSSVGLPASLRDFNSFPERLREYLMQKSES